MTAIPLVRFLEQAPLPLVLLHQHFRRELESFRIKIGAKIMGRHHPTGGNHNVANPLRRDWTGTRLVVGYQAGANAQTLSQILLTELLIHPELKKRAHIANYTHRIC